MSNFPTSISPCPIIEATLELKFNTEFPPNAILGIIYNVFKDSYPQMENLPITQIPEEIRLNDPNFKFKVFHKLFNDRFSIQVGYDVITIHCTNYLGWAIFQEKIIEFLDKVQKSKIIKNVKEVVLRYINFFEGINILESSNISINLMKSSVIDGNCSMKFELPNDKFNVVYQIANFAKLENLNLNIEKYGSILDISIVLLNPLEFFSNSKTIVSNLHNLEKEKFYGILNHDFVTTKLNPSY